MDPDEIDDAHEDDLDTPEDDLEIDDPDLGSEDDSPDEDLEPAAEDDEPVEAQPEPQPTRGQRRFQALSEEVKAARAEAAAARQEAEQLRQTRQSQDLARQEEERLALMSPEERIEYRVNQRLARVELNSWSASDAVTFEGLANRNPAVAALKDEVEAMFQQRLAAGAPVDRTTIATFLIGQKALAKAPRARAAGKRAEQAGRERNAVRPSSGRGDLAPASRRGGNEAEARRRRLENMEI